MPTIVLEAEAVLIPTCVEINTTVIMMRIIQLKPQAAQVFLTQMVREIKADVTILSERYRQIRESMRATESPTKATIWVCGQ